MERFRFQSFRVYHDAKEYSRFCRDIVRNRIEKTDRSLAEQIARALNSIVLNIAEGSADQSDAEFARFLTISIRSVYETVAGFDLGMLYGHIEKDSFEIVENKAHALVKQLVSFRQRLKEGFWWLTAGSWKPIVFCVAKSRRDGRVG
ncbi:MAG: four helix bundle protein [Desulfatiglandales bacterium]